MNFAGKLLSLSKTLPLSSKAEFSFNPPTFTFKFLEYYFLSLNFKSYFQLGLWESILGVLEFLDLLKKFPWKIGTHIRIFKSKKSAKCQVLLNLCKWIICFTVTHLDRYEAIWHCIISLNQMQLCNFSCNLLHRFQTSSYVEITSNAV